MSAVPSEIEIRGRGGRLALPAAAPAFVTSAAAVGLLGSERGGYYATAWSVATVAALAVGALATVRARGGRLARTDGVFLGMFAAFVVWIGVAALRPDAATRALPELERNVLYLAVVWAALQVVRRRTVAAAMAGVLGAICVLLLDGLVRLLVPTHIVADAFEGRLLFLPLGYANACGVLAAMGIVLALGFRSRAAATALVPLAVALALTQSRGAVAALALGLAAAALLHPRRDAFVGRALVLLPLPVLAAVLAARSHVTDDTTSSSVVAHDCLVVAALTVAASVAQAAFAGRAHRRLSPPPRLLAPLALVLAAAALGGIALGLGDRAAYWRVAAHDAFAHPLLGSGAGTFAREWLAHRPVASGVMNAHSLYLETLAEVGPAGLLLLVAALAVPLVVAARRRSPLGAVAGGAYATFLVHAGLDWDWQMPAVVAAGLLCGVCALRAGAADPPVMARSRRPALALAVLLAFAAAAAGVGNDALTAAARSAQAGAWSEAARSARIAAAWQPWSAEPQRLLGELAIAQGRPTRARALLVQALQRDPTDAAAWSDLARVGTAAERRVAVDRLSSLDPLASAP
jgi:hypothetical protein